MYKPIYLSGMCSKYYIDNHGHIKNVKTNKYLKLNSTDKDGYLIVSLTENGRHYTKKVHRLVAEAFIDNPDNKPEIHHKDGNRLNPDADNLMWCTKQEHVELDRKRVGKFSRARGERQGNAKYTDAQISQIVDELCKGTPFDTIRTLYNIDKHTLSHIYNRKSWCHISDGRKFHNYPKADRCNYDEHVKDIIRRHAYDDMSINDLIEMCGLSINDRTRNYVKTTRQRIRNKNK